LSCTSKLSWQTKLVEPVSIASLTRARRSSGYGCSSYCIVSAQHLSHAKTGTTFTTWSARGSKQPPANLTMATSIPSTLVPERRVSTPKVDSKQCNITAAYESHLHIQALSSVLHTCHNPDAVNILGVHPHPRPKGRTPDPGLTQLSPAQFRLLVLR
jgi:hypothetical protein